MDKNPSSIHEILVSCFKLSPSPRCEADYQAHPFARSIEPRTSVAKHVAKAGTEQNRPVRIESIRKIRFSVYSMNSGI